jgi:ABC-type multidrug transport system ATPase subunit
LNYTLENLYFEFKINDEWHSWQSLSDGTKRLFCLVTQVILANELILLEEPELGIHPHQLYLLMTFLKEQAETKQIILTTHAPQVLDILNDGELNRIIIAEMTNKGTQLRHLNEKQMKKAGIYLKDSFLSDYWRFSDLEPVTEYKIKKRLKQQRFAEFNRVMDKKGFFLLCIYELKAMILADIGF